MSDNQELKQIILDINRFLKYISSKYLKIILISTIGGVIGLGYAKFKQVRYEADLTFALEENNGSQISNYAGLANVLGIDVPNSRNSLFTGNNLIYLFTTNRVIVQSLLDSARNEHNETLLDFYFDRIYSKNIPVKYRLKFGNLVHSICTENQLTYDQDSILDKICERIRSKNIKADFVSKNVSLIELKCISSNEKFSKYFADAMINNVSKMYTYSRTLQQSKNVDNLKFRLDSVRTVLNTVLYSTANVIDKNQNPNTALLSVPRIKKEVELKVIESEYAELAKNLEVAKMTLMQQTPLVEIIDEPSLPLSRIKTSKIYGFIGGFFSLGLLALGFYFVKYQITKIDD